MRSGNIYLKYTVITIFASFLVGYAYYQSRSLIEGGEIFIEYPLSGSLLDTPIVEIRGKALRISDITLNDRKIYVDENGVFQEQVLLARGYNIFKIEIEDTFHYKKHQFIELIYEPKKGL